MGSKYSTELKESQKNSFNATSQAFVRVENDGNIDDFQFFGCWSCIRLKPRSFKVGKKWTSSEAVTDAGRVRNGQENHAMQSKNNNTEDKRWEQMCSDNGMESLQNDRNVVLAESNVDCEINDYDFVPCDLESKKSSIIYSSLSFSQKKSNPSKRSTSLKSCAINYTGTHNDVVDVSPRHGSGSESKKSFLSRLMSLSVDGKTRSGYVKQVDASDLCGSRGFEGQGCFKDVEEEEKTENDDLLDHGRYSCERQSNRVTSMEYFDSTPSTDDNLEEALRFQCKANHLSSDLYEESCLDNLESFCDRSVLLASMDTIDLGSSIESLACDSPSFVKHKQAISEEDGYVTMDAKVYTSLLEELETCKQILKQLEALISGIDSRLLEETPSIA